MIAKGEDARRGPPISTVIPLGGHDEYSEPSPFGKNGKMIGSGTFGMVFPLESFPNHAEKYIRNPNEFAHIYKQIQMLNGRLIQDGEPPVDNLTGQLTRRLGEPEHKGTATVKRKVPTRRWDPRKKDSKGRTVYLAKMEGTNEDEWEENVDVTWEMFDYYQLNKYVNAPVKMYVTRMPERTQRGFLNLDSMGKRRIADISLMLEKSDADLYTWFTHWSSGDKEYTPRRFFGNARFVQVTFSQMLAGVLFMHGPKARMAHMDIKPANVMVKSTEAGKTLASDFHAMDVEELKTELIDFDLSVKLDKGSEINDSKVTFWYRSPLIMNLHVIKFQKKFQQGSNGLATKGSWEQLRERITDSSGAISDTYGALNARIAMRADYWALFLILYEGLWTVLGDPLTLEQVYNGLLRLETLEDKGKEHNFMLEHLGLKLSSTYDEATMCVTSNEWDHTNDEPVVLVRESRRRVRCDEKGNWNFHDGALFSAPTQWAANNSTEAKAAGALMSWRARQHKLPRLQRGFVTECLEGGKLQKLVAKELAANQTTLFYSWEDFFKHMGWTTAVAPKDLPWDQLGALANDKVGKPWKKQREGMKHLLDQLRFGDGKAFMRGTADPLSNRKGDYLDKWAQRRQVYRLLCSSLPEWMADEVDELKRCADTFDRWATPLDQDIFRAAVQVLETAFGKLIKSRPPVGESDKFDFTSLDVDLASLLIPQQGSALSPLQTDHSKLPPLQRFVTQTVQDELLMDPSNPITLNHGFRFHHAVTALEERALQDYEVSLSRVEFVLADQCSGEVGEGARSRPDSPTSKTTSPGSNSSVTTSSQSTSDNELSDGGSSWGRGHNQLCQSPRRTY